MEPLEQVREEVLDRAERVEADDHVGCSLPCRGGRASGHARGRPRRGSRGCTGAGASRRRSSRGRARARGAPRARTCEHDGWYLHVPAGVSRPKVYRQACTGRSRATSCGHLADDLAELLEEPLVAACLRGLREPRPRGEDVVAAGGRCGVELAHASRSCRLSRLRPTGDPTARGIASPTRAVPSGRPPGRTSAVSGAGSRPSGLAGRPRRSHASGRGGGGAPRPASGGEALAALGATALQDRLAAARRHAGAEPVLALAAADVRLVGALHGGEGPSRGGRWSRASGAAERGV